MSEKSNQILAEQKLTRDVQLQDAIPSANAVLHGATHPAAVVIGAEARNEGILEKILTNLKILYFPNLPGYPTRSTVLAPHPIAKQISGPHLVAHHSGNANGRDRLRATGKCKFSIFFLALNFLFFLSANQFFVVFLNLEISINPQIKC